MNGTECCDGSVMATLTIIGPEATVLTTKRVRGPRREEKIYPWRWGQSNMIVSLHVILICSRNLSLNPAP